MSWADAAIAQLQAGRPATLTPRGNSMRPRVPSGATVEVTPVLDPASLQRGDIVLVRVHGSVYLHLVSATDTKRVQIANARGRVNGWVARTKVYGRAVTVNGRPVR